MVGQRDQGCHKVLGEVTCGFGDSAEERWTLYPSHLQCRRYDDPDRFSGRLGQDIRKIVAVGKADGESPEPIADIQLAEQDVESGRRIMHILEKPREDFSNLLD